MGFNYRQERKKFEERMQENEKKYRAAGMSDEQITAMREYEEEQFRRERIYKIHIVLEQSKEYPGLIEWAGTTDSYFQDLDSVLDDLSPGMSQRLTERDREVLVLLFADIPTASRFSSTPSGPKPPPAPGFKGHCHRGHQPGHAPGSLCV